MKTKILTDFQICISVLLMKICFPNPDSFSNIDDVRVKSFSKSPSSSLRSTILLRKGIVEQIKRLCFQAGWLWKECEQNINLPDYCRAGHLPLKY